MKAAVTEDALRQDLLCRNMYDQSKIAFMEHLRSGRAERNPYWENSVALMVVHLTTGALESFINAVLHLAEYWRQPRHCPVAADDLVRLVDKREDTIEKWKWLGRRASKGAWFDKSKEPMVSYVALVTLRNDLADHDKAPILRESEGWKNERRRHLVDKDLTHERAAMAIVTVTRMVASLRQAFLAGDPDCLLAADSGWKLVWQWAHVIEPEILVLAGLPKEPLAAWQ